MNLKRNLNLAIGEAEHKAAKIKSIEHGVTMSDLFVFAAQDDEIWERAAAARKATGGARAGVKVSGAARGAEKPAAERDSRSAWREEGGKSGKK
jgi:hypothetical protein